jgi:hypothetical protein
VKENNDLHLELLKYREQLDHHIKGIESIILFCSIIIIFK